MNIARGKVLRWFCSGATGVISVAATVWSGVFLARLGISPSHVLKMCLIVLPKFVLYLLPAWGPELLAVFAPSAERWMRLIAGAVCIGVGAAATAGFLFARALNASLSVIFLLYIGFGIYNWWYVSRSARDARSSGLQASS